MNMHLENKKLGNIDLLSDSFMAWLAGFIDGDGSIYVRIIRNNSYALKFQILVSVSFTQSLAVFHILEMIYGALGRKGHIRKKATVGDVVISDPVFLKKLLIRLLPFLYLKNRQAVLLLEIIDDYSALKYLPADTMCDDSPLTEKQAAFLKVCEKVENIAALNSPIKANSRRKITIDTVKEAFYKNK